SSSMARSRVHGLGCAGSAWVFMVPGEYRSVTALTLGPSCAKCALKETESCKNVLQVKEGDKMVTYYLVHNDVSKKFHDNICRETKKITVTGTVKVVDGKQQLTRTKIELSKAD